MGEPTAHERPGRIGLYCGVAGSTAVSVIAVALLRVGWWIIPVAVLLCIGTVVGVEVAARRHVDRQLHDVSGEGEHG